MTESSNILEARSPEEWQAAVELLHAYRKFAEEDLGIPPFPFGTFENSLAHLPEDFSPPNGRFFLLRSGSEYVGCIGYHRLESLVAEIKRMFLFEKFRGKGGGKLLLGAALQAISADGYQRVRLDTHPKMASAIQLYEHFGFRRIPRYNNHPLPEIIFMELELQIPKDWGRTLRNS